MSRANSKADEIRDEIRRTPCRRASEISEEYGVSPATVGRVAQNLDEDLKQMRELRMKKHIKDLYDIERDILWIVAQHPGASQTEVKKAYERQTGMDGFKAMHPETGDDAPSTVGDLWRDCLDSGWQGRIAIANDLQILLDEDRVSDAAEQAVEALEGGKIDVNKNDRDSEPKEGTARYMRYEIADAVVEDGTERFIEKSNRELRLSTLKAVAGVLGIKYQEDIGRRDISEKLAAEVGHSDPELIDKHGRFPKTVIKDLRDAVLEAVDDGGTDEDVDEPDHKCEYCGDTFASAAGRGKHEKHCDERPEDDDARDESDNKSVEVAEEKQDLTETNIETLRTIVDEDIEDLNPLASALDMSYQGVVSRLRTIRQRGWRIASDNLVGDAERILDEYEDDEPSVEVQHGGSGTDRVLADESDDVDLQEEPTDRDMELEDTSVEEVFDEQEETPHVKNESGVDYERAIEQLQLMHEHGIQADRVEIYNEEGETKFDANGVVFTGGGEV